MSAEPTGLLAPFRRDRKRDFASGAGAELLASKVMQALMTCGATPRSSGELPWRTSFGAGLDILRHQRNDAALAELARVQVRDALKRWVPEAELVEVTATRDGANLQLKVRFHGAKNAAEAATTEIEIAVPR
jgi:phage baseplate assembly protein W